MKVSPCLNPDLFWALRGGGGGTFGVVTSVTIRTFEDAPMVFYSINVTIPFASPNDSASADATLWELVAQWHSIAPAVNDITGSAYYFILPRSPGMSAHVFISVSMFPGHKDPGAAAKVLEPFITWANGQLGGPPFVNASVIPFPTVAAFLDGFIGQTQSGMGVNIIMGSRLVSREKLTMPEGVQEVATTLREINELGGTVQGLFVAGGKVAANKDIDSALNPAWRKALTSIVITLEWEFTDSFEKIAELKKLMTEVLVPKLKKLDWDPVKNKQTMGAYVNEADKEDKDWQDSYWGPNYDRLKKLKRKWDPKGVFWCRPCVGSEEWDLEGICRV